MPLDKRAADQTLGGFVFTQMGRVPTVAESFEWQGLRFEIVDMDGKRIDKVLVMANTSEAPDDRNRAQAGLSSAAPMGRGSEAKD